MTGSDLTYVIGGLSLPPDLIAALKAGVWRAPAEEDVYKRVFNDTPELPMFYDLGDIVQQNTSWRRFSVAQAYGVPVGNRSMGIDPQRSILIGDLGPDMPFALDYRVPGPRVLYLRGDPAPAWVPVADSVGTLCALLGIAIPH